jgi:hypothetical protein
MGLNEIHSTGPKLPVTDSRNRPDMQLMEQGEIDNASDEKLRLEVKQRAQMVRYKLAKEIPSPRFVQ